MSDKEKGIYRKFNVSRTDGSSEPGGKHEDCTYFVLDLDHDPHAKAALRAYQKSCCDDFPELGSDLLIVLDWCEFGKPVAGAE